MYATGVLKTQAGKGDSAPHPAQQWQEMHPGTKECLHPEAETKVFMEGVSGYAWEGRCAHPLEPGSHKELGVRLLITFGNSQERFAQTRRRRTTRK